MTHRRLKADLHLHTSEDPEDKVRYSARQLIDYASQKGFDVLAITNHNFYTYNDYLRDYAASKGILLIPGIELSVQEKHIVLLNITDNLPQKIRSLQDLRHYKNEGSLVVAPHPYFPMYQVGLTYSLIDAEKTPEAVIGAIRKKRIQIVTHPLRLTFFNVFLSLKHFLTQGVNHCGGLILGPRNSKGSETLKDKKFSGEH